MSVLRRRPILPGGFAAILFACCGPDEPPIEIEVVSFCFAIAIRAASRSAAGGECRSFAARQHRDAVVDGVLFPGLAQHGCGVRTGDRLDDPATAAVHHFVCHDLPR
ncbi:hypothetical protein [Rhodopirellula islandica]|uniref:hypothetical protein n=1 Tax=Rhodopirellula islandica TaxID=595434 RepID=UPI001F2B2060|nr:hypothetical protein [Rhodopirellula islandica]